MKTINDFWNKFRGISKIIREFPEEDNIIQLVDNLVKTLGDFSWEYGPSINTDFYFSLSPNLNPDNLVLIKDIISSAPKIEGWEFIAGKPKKREFIPSWIILDDKEEEIKINASNWRCIIYKYSDNTYDLDVEITNLNCNEDTKYYAVDIHLINLIGELSYIELITDIKIVSKFSPEEYDKSIMMKDILKYL